MTIRELIDMTRQYGLDPDAEIYMRPLKKDAPRKALNISREPGKVILTATVEKTSANRRPRPHMERRISRDNVIWQRK